MDISLLFERGGPLMWPILICSVIAAIVFVERLIALRRRDVAPRQLFSALQKALTAGDTLRAEQLAREDSSLLARVAAAGLRRMGSSRPEVKIAMEETGSIEVGRLERFVNVLATVAAIAPLLGLLGTVTGMIDVFADIAGADNPDIAQLAGGIWKALVTTGAGLSVAIPVFVAYRFIESRIDAHSRQLEEDSVALLDLIAPPHAGAPPVDSPELSAP